VISVVTDDDMQNAGEALAAQLQAGDVLCLVGPLGAGKTTMVRGLARGLGVVDRISSPTFVIARRHAGSRIDLLHCDTYRIGSEDEFADLALETANAVAVVEWGGEFVELLADDWLEVSIDRGLGSSDEVRHVELSGHGHRWPAEEVTKLAAAITASLGSTDLQIQTLNEVSDDSGD
jgi:tRNA threonylcarbamoyladenosine biosynthesis protein TsaE